MVGCEGIREALSARLDGEDEPGERAPVDAHLAGCVECRRWLDDAAVVTRMARTGPAVAGADVSQAVLAAAPGRWRGRLGLGLRVGLAGLGVAQVVLGVLQVTALRGPDPEHVHGSALDGATPGHLWHESAAWNVALGAAFLWVSVRRGRPAGLLPVLSVFIGALVLLSAADLVDRQVEGVRLVSHGFVLAGFLIVLALSRPVFGTEVPPGSAGRARRWLRVRQPAALATVTPLPSRHRAPAAEARRRAAG